MADDDDTVPSETESETIESPDAPGAETPEPARVSGERISSPRKVMRIGAMLKQLLDEIRSTPLDQTSREKLAEVHDASVKELCACLSPDLQDELKDLTLPFSNEGAEGAELTDVELRIAQAQLVGWLEGLLHGIQTALTATGAKKADDPASGKEKTEKPKPDPANRPGQYL